MAAIDITGQRFGGLVAVARVDSDRRGAIWRCECDCGGTTTAPASVLRSGRQRGCGCGRLPRLQLVGERFGLLVVTGKVEQLRHGDSRWSVRCDCGSERAVLGSNLRGGHSRSCGCVSREKLRAASRTHGGSQTATYQVWRSMRQRCCNPNDPNFADYGGRGIGICTAWRLNFAAFLADMGSRPTDRSIDRINNDRGYDCGHCDDCNARGAPANCRWATRSEQASNTRRNIIVEIGDERRTMAEWCRYFGVSRATASIRIKHGWDPALAVSTLPHQRATAAGRRGGMLRQHNRRAA